MKASGTRTNLTEPNQALQRMNVLVTDYAPSSILRAKHVHRWALTFGRFKTISELVMRIAKNCVYLLTLNMRMSIETAARTPMLNRKVHAESDFRLGCNLGIAKWVFSYSNSEFAYKYRGCVRRPKQKRRVNAEFGLANWSFSVF